MAYYDSSKQRRRRVTACGEGHRRKQKCNRLTACHYCTTRRVPGRYTYEEDYLPRKVTRSRRREANLDREHIKSSPLESNHPSDEIAY